LNILADYSTDAPIAAGPLHFMALESALWAINSTTHTNKHCLTMFGVRFRTIAQNGL